MVSPNLLETLLRFAASSQPAEEDPITEVLAWSVAHEPAFKRAFIELLRLPAEVSSTFVPGVSTQVVTPRAHGGGLCRYDLVLDDRALPLRVIIEVKVNAGLTASGADVPPGERERHQVDDYLALASADRSGTHVVYTLAPGEIELGRDACAHPCFGRSLRWQEVHDAFARTIRRDRSAQIDPIAKAVALQFLDVMEVRKMAHPKLTYDGAVAVRPFMRFRRSFDELMTATWNALYADGTLDGFHKVNASAWQDEHQRLGYRLWAKRHETSCFGFIGMYFGDDTIVDDMPDLYFFLEAPPRSGAHRALEERAVDLAAIVERLRARGGRTEWGWSPGEHQVLWAARSIADMLAAQDPRGDSLAWFRDTISAARETGMIAIYLDAVNAK